jgi:predicted transcriptional regulator
LFETTFKEKIPLSTVSTYLTRLTDRGVLERQQEKLGLAYRVRLDEQKQSLAPAPSLQPS